MAFNVPKPQIFSPFVVQAGYENINFQSHNLAISIRVWTSQTAFHYLQLAAKDRWTSTSEIMMHQYVSALVYQLRNFEDEITWSDRTPGYSRHHYDVQLVHWNSTTFLLQGAQPENNKGYDLFLACKDELEKENIEYSRDWKTYYPNTVKR